MRRVASYGGPSSVPASQRLKHKLAETAGMRVFSDRLSQEQGFLAPLPEEEDGRVLHSTSWATRNFFATASTLKKFVKGPRFWGSSVTEPTVCCDERRNGDAGKADVAGTADVEFPAAADGLTEPDGNFRTCSIEKNVGPSNIDGHGSQVALNEGSSTTMANMAGFEDPRTLIVQRHKRSASEPVNFYVPATSGCQNASLLLDEKTSLGIDGKSQSSKSKEEMGLFTEDSNNKGTTTKSGVGINCNYKPSCSLITPVELQTGQNNFSGNSAPKEILKLETEYQNGDDITEGEIESDVNRKLPYPKHAAAAGLKIQSFYRQWCTRRRYLSILKATSQVQAVYFRQRAMMEYQSLRNVVIACQRMWRRNRSYRMHRRMLAAEEASLQFELAQHRAASLIQCIWKGYIQKKRYLELLQNQHDCDTAARVIQRNWRWWQQRSWKKRDWAAKTQATVTIQAFVRGSAVRAMIRFWHHSAATIQRNWRDHQHKVSSVAALRIQSRWRTHVARKKLQQLQVQNDLEQKAATLLQALFRGHLVRRAVQRQRSAALIVQRCWRNMRLERQHHAAVVIQSFYRGFISRINLSKNIEPLQVDHQPQEEPTLVAGLFELDIAGSTLATTKASEQTCGQLENLHTRIDISLKHRLSGDSSMISQDGNLHMGGYTEPINERAHSDKDSDTLIKQVASVSESESRGEHSLANLCNNLVSSPVSGGRPLESAQTLSSELMLSKPDTASEAVLRGFSNEWACLDIKDKASSSHVHNQHEDWNDVQIDDLDECLDTCLAELKPFPAIWSTELDEQMCQHSHMLSTSGSTKKAICRNGEDCAQDVCKAVADSVAATSVTGVSVDESKTLGSRRSWSGENGKKEENSPKSLSTHEKMERQMQASAIHQLNMQRNEERLQHFAQVFLLQRQIAQQQLKAQSAPPFPPQQDTQESESHPLEVSDRVQNGVIASSSVDILSSNYSVAQNGLAARSFGMQSHGTGSQDEGVAQDSLISPDGQTSSSCPLPSESRPRKEVLLNVSREHEGDGFPSTSSQNYGTRLAGTDVVVDIIELLEKLDAVYGASQPHAEYLTSPILLSKETIVYIGDEEMREDRKNGRQRGDLVGTKRLGMPDVNAMLVILVALVVYTRTIFRTSFLWSRESQRRQ